MPTHIQRRQPYIKAQSGWPPGRPPIGISEVYWTMLVFFAPLKADDINNIMRDGLEKASTVSPRRKMTVKWGRSKNRTSKRLNCG